MVSSQFVLGLGLGLVTFSSVAQAYPIRSDAGHANDHASSPTGLETRSPEPRLKDPFGIDTVVSRINDMIPVNGDLSAWINEAIRQGLHYGSDDKKDDTKNNLDIANPASTNGGKSKNNAVIQTPATPTNVAIPSPVIPSTVPQFGSDPKDPFGIHSLVSSLNSIFDGLDSADEIVPS